MPSTPKPDYWAAVEPEDFEYGRTYQLRTNNYSGGTPVYEIPNTGASESREVLALSNIEAIERDESLQDKIAYGRIGSSFRNVIYRADEDPPRAVKEIIGALSEYPVLSDEIHSEMESEIAEHDWENYGRVDFIKRVLAFILQKALENEGIEVDDEDDIIDVLNDHEDAVDQVWSNIRGFEYQEVNPYGTVFQWRSLQHYLGDQLTDEELYKELRPVLDLFDPAPAGTMRPL